jgi:hypothetical protein
MVGVEGKPPSKDLKVRIAIIVMIVIILGFVLWFFVLPFFERHEMLYIVRYYWVKNNLGEIRMLVVDWGNNGTQDLTVSEVWVNGARLGNDFWGGWFGVTVLHMNGNRFYVAPNDLLFQVGQSYNLTIVSSSKRQYSFMLNVNENNTKTENITISALYFYHEPPLTGGPVIGMDVQNVGDTDIIIREVLVNGSSCTLPSQFMLDSSEGSGGFYVGFPWKTGENYTVTVETIAGTTASRTGTAG